MSFATVKLKPDSSSTLRPNSTLVPSMRITIGTAICKSRAAARHSGSQHVAAQDAAEDIDQHRLHGFVRQQDAESVLDLLRVGAAADVQEIRRTSARVLNDVHGAHRQTRAVHHAGDVAVQLDVVQAELGGFDFQRILFVQVAKFHQFFVAEQARCRRS